MEKTRNLLLWGTAAVSAVLAGCTTTGTTGGGSTSNAVYADDAGTASAALAGGETLMAYNASMSRSAVKTGDGNWVWLSDPEAPEVSFELNDQGGVDVTIDGTTVSFSASDLNGEFGWQSGNNGIYTWSAESAQQALDGDGFGEYHQVWSYFWDTGEETLNGYAVIGTETTSDAVAARTASATYSGWAVADSYTVGSDSNDRTRLSGDLTLAADFDAGTIGGTVDDISVKAQSGGSWGAATALTGTIALETATISGNGYTGTLTPDATFLTETSMSEFDGTYGGKFYGPDAEETAGTIGFSGSDGDDFVGTGFFSAVQD
ncbi:transferrin-binding protein-like solute binding protein [Pelagibacterium halotolerans]|uniref:transferrin-binding protein-like solute binding protein n=1 Tax=Pelagibacterium halotolerans TaxID=531813 RepID=UPI00384A5FA4